MLSLRFLFLPCALACAFLAACSSPQHDFARDLEQHKQVATPTMVGEASFFAGQLLVEVNLGHGFRARPKKGIFANDDRPLYEENEAGEQVMRRPTADDEDYFVPRMHNSILPPKALRLRVTNLSPAPVQIEFLECNSALGNFVVRPATATIAPGESYQPEAMISLLGTSGEPFPVRVGLRLGHEKQATDITVSMVANPPPAPGPSRP